ncbi:5-(carboxyamino)imidazole ribonucleotide synthase [Neobacillus terrae]|uniref:5-(carboxyamino)imidazole ribonucleotide synthase n=1 Tax=Neobacillus terrae TaxID=3034837 RepID=UPI00140E7F3F|nr:5-(carboxyamino)imidazole ribonucleotide synthase [Neobacillus terrae]NHM29502.1 5-(carboxyamino)imidazole ribonucleotide synthase [Neobacillus terrae]
MSNKVILPGQTIGIIGGGQLGRMMALAAKAQGFRIAVLDPEENSPCGQVADIEVTGGYNDMEAIRTLAEISDVITYEFENIDAEALNWLCQNAYVPQGERVLKITQDRLNEKQAILEAGLYPVPFERVDEEEELGQKINRIGGFPAVLKTAKGGYDGKGQYVIRREDDIENALILLAHGSCVLEKWIEFEKEISIIVTRKIDGEMKFFPAAENVHKNNILHKTIVPALISDDTEHKAKRMAGRLADYLELVGTLAVEMFVGKDGELYINEMAPRPHNSGHYTIEACETSQFEQHIRALCSWELGSTELLKPAVMYNILGQHLEPLLETIPAPADWKIHLYGKKEPRENRKMGHITILEESLEKAEASAAVSLIWNEKKAEGMKLA